MQDGVNLSAKLQKLTHPWGDEINPREKRFTLKPTQVVAPMERALGTAMFGVVLVRVIGSMSAATLSGTDSDVASDVRFLWDSPP
jgi:hypothetical protein